MATAVEFGRAVPLASLSAVERSLAAAQVLLDHEDSYRVARTAVLREGGLACRQLVGQVERQSGLRLQPKDVSRYLRLDVGEVAQALKSLEGDSLEGHGSVSPAAQAGLKRCLATTRDLVAALQSLAYAEGERPLSLPSPFEPGLETGALSANKALFLSGVVGIARLHLASAHAWLDTASCGITPTLEQSYEPEEVQAMQGLGFEADAQLLLLVAAFHLPRPLSPWAQALSQRLLDACNAACVVFESARIIWPAGAGAPPNLVPALAVLVTTLKDLHRGSL